MSYLGHFPVVPALHGSVNLPEARVVHVYNFEKWGLPGSGTDHLVVLSNSHCWLDPSRSVYFCCPHITITMLLSPSVLRPRSIVWLFVWVSRWLKELVWVLERWHYLLLQNKFNVIRMKCWTETFRLIDEFILWLQCCETSRDDDSQHKDNVFY